MPLEFPYQLVIFLDKHPAIGEPVYYGEHGWYPQIAIKRRFKIMQGSEEEFLKDIETLFSTVEKFNVGTKALVKTDRMPVRVIEIENSDELVNFHVKIMKFLDGKIESRYPERDGDNYYPHITAEHEGELRIDVQRYSNASFTIKEAYLLKDITDANSVAYANFKFESPHLVIG